MIWLLRRIAQGLLTVLTVITFSFVLIRYMPGGPMDYLMAQLLEGSSGSVNMERIHRQVERYVRINPDEPIWQQYLGYMASILRGDLGESYWFSRPVSDILVHAIPWTILVMSTALLIGFFINVALGAFMAYKEGSRFDVSLTLFSIVSTSIPFYIAAILFIALFSIRWSIFPDGGRVDPTLESGFTIAYMSSVLYHAALPVASSVIIGLGGGALVMRGNSIQVLGEDYLRVARLRGLSERRIALRYVGRNAILPMYTGLMIAIGNIFGGSVILETIFTYPGVGYYMFIAVESRDYPLLMGTFIVITVAVVIALFVADLTYSKLDPRATGGGGSNESY